MENTEMEKRIDTIKREIWNTAYSLYSLDMDSGNWAVSSAVMTGMLEGLKKAGKIMGIAENEIENIIKKAEGIAIARQKEKEQKKIEKGEYPDEGELETIREWDDYDPFKLAEYLCEIWNTNYGKCSLKGKKVKILELVTGGWSGNEEIIQALEGTMFWQLYWMESRRGGHYKFRIYKLKKERGKHD